MKKRLFFKLHTDSIHLDEAIGAFNCMFRDRYAISKQASLDHSCIVLSVLYNTNTISLVSSISRIFSSFGQLEFLDRPPSYDTDDDDEEEQYEPIDRMRDKISEAKKRKRPDGHAEIPSPSGNRPSGYSQDKHCSLHR